MKHVVAKSSNVNINFLEISMPLLFASRRAVSLAYHNYFTDILGKKLGPTKGQEADAHHVFNFNSMNEEVSFKKVF